MTPPSAAPEPTPPQERCSYCQGIGSLQRAKGGSMVKCFCCDGKGITLSAAVVTAFDDLSAKLAKIHPRQEDPTDAETATLQTSDIKQGGQNGAICQAAIARQEGLTDANG